MIHGVNGVSPFGNALFAAVINASCREGVVAIPKINPEPTFPAINILQVDVFGLFIYSIAWFVNCS